MSSSFTLKIQAADKLFYDGPAVSVTVPAYDGGLQILAHHENMVVATKEGVVRFRVADGEEERRGIVGIGFTHISNNTVTILVDSAERPEDIDRVRAQEALERAKEQLRQDQSIQEYHISQASLARAMVRLSEPSKFNE